MGKTWLTVEIRLKGPCELGGGFVVKNEFEGTNIEDNGTWEGM